MKRKAKQLRLPVTQYRVTCYRFVDDVVVQAASASAAKYDVFKRAREAGYFTGRQGFRDFLSEGWRVREVRL
jgi:hypothetical protein